MNGTENFNNDLSKIANNLRIRILDIVNKFNTSHIGSCYSVIDILVVLYDTLLNVSPTTTNEKYRDRLFMSKGHASLAIYTILEYYKFFKNDLLDDFTRNGTFFTGHVNSKINGVDYSTGSLGHALGVACGSALNSKINNINNKIVVIASDGELNEGSNWEAILFASQFKLDNLILIIDFNKIQSFGFVKDVMNLDPLDDKFRSFNWDCINIDGHNYQEIFNSFSDICLIKNSKPKCIIAHTIKGKGVSFMENKLLWHYKSPNSEEYKLAMNELNKNA